MWKDDVDPSEVDDTRPGPKGRRVIIVKSAFEDALAKRRIPRDIKTTALAKRLRVDPDTIRRIQRGDRINWKTAETIALQLKVPVRHLTAADSDENRGFAAILDHVGAAAARHAKEALISLGGYAQRVAENVRFEGRVYDPHRMQRKYFGLDEDEHPRPSRVFGAVRVRVSSMPFDAVLSYEVGYPAWAQLTMDFGSIIVEGTTVRSLHLAYFDRSEGQLGGDGRDFTILTWYDKGARDFMLRANVDFEIEELATVPHAEGLRLINDPSSSTIGFLPKIFHELGAAPPGRA